MTPTVGPETDAEHAREVELVAGALRMVSRGYPGVTVGGLHEGDVIARELSDAARDLGLVVDVLHHPGDTQCSVHVSRAVSGHA